VVLTAFVVGAVAAGVVPGLTFGAALVLGAVVAPRTPSRRSRSAARLGMPKRVMTILTGESLVNDAAALTLFSVAVAAITGTRTCWRTRCCSSAIRPSSGGGRPAARPAVQWIRRHLPRPRPGDRARPDRAVRRVPAGR